MNPPQIKGKVLFGEPMAKHTSLGVGGPAEVLAWAEDPEDLRQLVQWAVGQGMPVLVIGAGTNLLVSDVGVRGLVIKLGSGFRRIHVLPASDKRGLSDGEREQYSEIIAGAAVPLSELVKRAVDAGLTGLEALAGIPGTVGGAVVMNAGTQAGETKDTLTRVRALDLAGNLLEVPASELGLGYRSSRVAEKGLIIAEATFAVKPGDRALINERVEKLLAQRRENQPLAVRTCGSVFKNPPGDSAGRLLDEAGAKGMSVGGARVSAKHANWIENEGRATARDIFELMNLLQALVRDKFGIRLEPEVQIVGEW